MTYEEIISFLREQQYFEECIMDCEENILTDEFVNASIRWNLLDHLIRIIMKRAEVDRRIEYRV